MSQTPFNAAALERAVLLRLGASTVDVTTLRMAIAAFAPAAASLHLPLRLDADGTPDTLIPVIQRVTGCPSVDLETISRRKPYAVTRSDAFSAALHDAHRPVLTVALGGDGRVEALRMALDDVGVQAHVAPPEGWVSEADALDGIARASIVTAILYAVGFAVARSRVRLHAFLELANLLTQAVPIAQKRHAAGIWIALTA